MPPVYAPQRSSLQRDNRISSPSFVTQALPGHSPFAISPGHGYGDSKTAINRCPSPARVKGTGQRKTLVIDLDETLVHSQFEPCRSDMYVPMTMDGTKYTAYVFVRPGCEEFLRKAGSLFDVVIWTASLQCYAGKVIDELEKKCGIRLLRMYRESCTKLHGGYVKDLRKLGKLLQDIAIVDNSPGVAALNTRNLIHVKNYYDDKRDRALYDLLPVLDSMAQSATVYDAIHHRR